ncbi:hypothetical protein D3C76_1886240 [compost metagenome]
MPQYTPLAYPFRMALGKTLCMALGKTLGMPLRKTLGKTICMPIRLPFIVCFDLAGKTGEAC